MSAPADTVTMYEYRATVIRVVDGDTIDLAVDLGFRVTFTDRVRLVGVDAPEIRAPTFDAGRAARTWLDNLILGRPVTIESHKPATDKYGRWLVTMRLDGVDVGAALVDAGHATVHTYP